MRKVSVSKIRDTVADLCLKANFELREDVLAAIRAAVDNETEARARRILESIIENARLAKSKRLAICQDTGIVVVHLQLGQNVSLTGGSLISAINEGVSRAYMTGCLRSSVVGDVRVRKNTMNNTPAVIHTEIVKGDKVKITVSPKGFGSENKSAIKMFIPTASDEEIEDFIIEVVKKAGTGACPPVILGIGMGGTFDEASLLAKKALLEPVGSSNPKPHMAKLERELISKINSLGIGPMGLGGKTTILGLRILDYPTHIAGLPVAVNVSCHATRSAERTI
ncbi:MAG: fumarate hydratase [Candidatus Omnitrophica bacterium]|nr:fumarate hydratase [Candidatus Omnitrophota bacterium]MCM8791130.1 fumarate hydratase [Candidatus Omnitrophota bacterium]